MLQTMNIWSDFHVFPGPCGVNKLVDVLKMDAVTVSKAIREHSRVDSYAYTEHAKQPSVRLVKDVSTQLGTVHVASVRGAETCGFALINTSHWNRSFLYACRLLNEHKDM